MSEHQPCSPLAFGRKSGVPPRERRDGSELAVRPPVQGKIGFVGLGHMGTAMAANLVAAGCHVTGYVRRQELMDKVDGLGVIPTMNMTELFDCEIVITMLSDDEAVRGIVLGDENNADG